MWSHVYCWELSKPLQIATSDNKRYDFDKTSNETKDELVIVFVNAYEHCPYK